MNLSEIEELIKEFKASDLGHLKLKHEHFELVLDKESAYTKKCVKSRSFSSLHPSPHHGRSEHAKRPNPCAYGMHPYCG